MKQIIITSIWVLMSIQIVFSQGSNATANIKNNSVNFGIRFTHEVSLPTGAESIVGVKLEVLKAPAGMTQKQVTRDYYQSNDLNKFGLYFEEVEDKVVTYTKKEEAKYLLTIPPLEANHFYRLKIDYINDADNIYDVFLTMHKEGSGNVYRDKMAWMLMLDKVSDKVAPNHIYYLPTLKDVQNYKAKIQTIDLNHLSEANRIQLKKITLEQFPILKYKVPNFEEIEKYARFVKITPTFSYVEIAKFLDVYFGAYVDYENSYAFYEEYLKPQLLINPDLVNNFKEFTSFVKAKMEVKNDEYIKDGLYKIELKPNFLKALNIILYEETHELSTYAETFETAYQRTLVPDFGLVGYNGNENNIKGTPFVGVNIAFAPVNKNVPMSLSQLSTMQRLSGHVGVTLNSLSEDNKRDDFFKSNSLMLGIGYKAFTQATRINFGGMFYRKMDPFNGDKSIAVYPYVGVSIDLEIRKWLHGLIPSLTGNFK